MVKLMKMQQKISQNMTMHRKGLFMTSSIGLRCDLYDLEERVGSDLTAIPTYYIEKNKTAKDPELNLLENLEKRMV